jgi:hypothetical protein
MSSLFNGDVTHPKATISELAKILPSRDVEMFERLVHHELYVHGIERFGLETILSWIDTLSNESFHRGVLAAVDALERRKIKIPEDAYIRWGMRALNGLDQKPGALLLIKEAARDSAEIDLEKVAFEASLAASRGDHAAHRLYIFLIHRWRSPVRRTLTYPKLCQLAHIIYNAYQKDTTQSWDFEFLLKVAQAELAPETYRRLYDIFKAAVHEHQKNMRRHDRDSLQTLKKLAPKTT